MVVQSASLQPANSSSARQGGGGRAGQDRHASVSTNTDDVLAPRTHRTAVTPTWACRGSLSAALLCRSRDLCPHTALSDGMPSSPFEGEGSTCVNHDTNYRLEKSRPNLSTLSQPVRYCWCSAPSRARFEGVLSVGVEWTVRANNPATQRLTTGGCRVPLRRGGHGGGWPSRP